MINNINYESRCLKKLKEMGAPLEGWFCVGMIDEETPTFVCELCGCEKVRYVHVMHHDDFEKELYVGCICAGVLEDNILAAKDRDRKMKNRARRKKTFMKKEWRAVGLFAQRLVYHGRPIVIDFRGDVYRCRISGGYTEVYHGKPITDFITARLAAFDLADPIEEVMQ